MDALGLAYAFRELRAWSKAGKTGALRVKFVGGRINGVRRSDALGRREMEVSLREDGFPCAGCGELLIGLPDGQLGCSPCQRQWTPEEVAEGLEDGGTPPGRPLRHAAVSRLTVKKELASAPIP